MEHSKEEVREHQEAPPTSFITTSSFDRWEGRISPRMREQDADLLECMHYAASQVSQYSPDGIALLRPQDRSLPMEDVPLMLMPTSSISEKHHSFPYGRATNFPSDIMEGLGGASPALSNARLEHLSLSCNNSRSQSRQKSVHFTDSEATIHSSPSFPEEPSSTNNTSSDGVGLPLESQNRRDKFRRLLSGEIRAVPNDESEGGGDVDDVRAEIDTVEDSLNHSSIHERKGAACVEDQKETNEDGDTTASPLSLHQEIVSAKSEQDEGLAEQRRKSEAIQFAQAVGEQISINRDDLRIIEDNEKEDSDDDEAIESKEIMIPNHLDQAHELIAISSNQNHHSDPLEHEVTVTPNAASQAEVMTTSSSVKLPNADFSNHVDVHSAPMAHHQRRKSRPMWPFEQPTDVEYRITEHLSGGVGERNDFVYKGICANPPEITKRGIQRGNYAQLHRKAWLEVSDKYHRYGKNLRLYYRYWERLGFPTNQFFDWLDSKGEAAGEPLPWLEECPRSVLDSDTVLYITNPNVTNGYALDVIVNEDGRGRILDVDGDPVLSGPDGWIFVLRDNVMYGAPKITSISGHSKQRFHHSSFFGGKAVASAGILITDEDGCLTRLYPHSGHYRPGEAHLQRMLLFIHRKGVDLRTFDIDMQQLIHVSREKDEKKKNIGNRQKEEEDQKVKKVAKVDSLHLERAVDVACYLAHKADFIGSGIFDRIHKIRNADATSVTEALNLVDDGGYWREKATMQGCSE